MLLEELSDIINEYLSNKKLAVTAFVDLSDTFDTFNPESLLNQLESFVIRGNLLRYGRDRFQAVKIRVIDK